MSDIRAIIFDFDGVLVHGEPHHMQAWISVLKSIGLTLTEKDFNEKYLGFGDRDFLPIFLKDQGRALAVSEQAKLITAKQRLLMEAYRKKIPVLSGAQEILEAACKQYPLALVTGSQDEEVYFILDQLNWRRFFKNIITHTHVTKGKPDPEGFLKAFPGIPPENILVIEDSPRGLMAAKRAGMICVAVENSYPASQLQDAHEIYKNTNDLAHLFNRNRIHSD